MDQIIIETQQTAQQSDSNLPAYISFVRDLKRYWSREEKILWAQLNEGKIKGYQFIRRHPIIVYKKDNTISFYIADFFCGEKKLLLEIDRQIDDRQYDFNKARDFILNKLEMQVLRISKEEINTNLPAVLKKIRAFLKQLDANPVYT